MPTPVGHAVGGLATAWFAQSLSRRAPRAAPVAIACALAAMVPDVDLLLGSHRTYTHSIAATVVAGVIAWIILRRRMTGAGMVAATIAAAYGSHVLLDWLGKDSSMPPGVMALWPFSTRFYISGFDVFGEVSRRYWKPDEFIVGNLMAVGKEIVILGPIAIVAWILSRR
jgi:membrane-bound metal-dependent hydrolase YbcI (DUF457 family)